jgi:hypothetical protein
MHPHIYQELAKIKIAEQLQYAERQRLLRDAVNDRPRSIDFASLGQRLRVRLFGGTAWGTKSTGGTPAGATP